MLESTVIEEYSYVYTGGKLMQMVVKTTTTPVDGEATIATETLNFSYDASGVPMAVNYGGTDYYYVTNIQGDVMAILNTSGNAVVEYTYDAWGNIHTTTGTLAETLGEVNPLTYRGYVYDRDSDYYYLQSRYYDPEVGRFINADGFVSTGQGLLGNNMFAYCNNTPENLVDNHGTVPQPFYGVEEDELGKTEYINKRTVTVYSPRYRFKGGRPGIVRMSADNVLGNLASYNVNKSLSSGTGYNNHHLIEFRWSSAKDMPNVFTNYGQAPSVIITKELHQEITNKARGAYPYGQTAYSSTDAKVVIEYYKKLYREMGKIDWVEYIESFFE